MGCARYNSVKASRVNQLYDDGTKSGIGFLPMDPIRNLGETGGFTES